MNTANTYLQRFLPRFTAQQESTATMEVVLELRKIDRPYHDRRFKDRRVTEYMVVARIPALETEAKLTSPYRSEAEAIEAYDRIRAERGWSGA